MTEPEDSLRRSIEDALRYGKGQVPEFSKVEVQEWAENFGAWLGADKPLSVERAVALMLSAVVAAAGQISLSREQILANTGTTLEIRRTPDHVILFVGEATDGLDDSP